MDGLLEKFGHMPAVEALPIMLLLVAYQGLAFALLSWLVRRAVELTGRPLALLAPLVMVTIELVVPQIFPYYLAIARGVRSAPDPGRGSDRAPGRDGAAAGVQRRAGRCGP